MLFRCLEFHQTETAPSATRLDAALAADLPQGYPQKVWTGPDSVGAAESYRRSARSHLRYRRQLTPTGPAAPGEPHQLSGRAGEFIRR